MSVFAYTIGSQAGFLSLCGMDSFLALSFSKPVVQRALAYAVVVGAILITINHGDAIIVGDIDNLRWIKMGLTVVVPYTVSTLSSVQAIMAQHR